MHLSSTRLRARFRADIVAAWPPSLVKKGVEVTSQPEGTVSKSVALDAAAAVASLREHMEERGTAAYLSFDPDNQTYLTGFRALLYSRPIVLFLTSTSSSLIVPEIEQEHSRSLARVDEVLVYRERPDGSMLTSHVPLLASLLEQLSAGARVAVDAERLPLIHAEGVGSSGREVVAFDDVLRSMRAVKRADELAAMRVAGGLAQIGVSASVEVARSGVSELEIDAAGGAAIYRRAAELGADSTVDLLVMTPSGAERCRMSSPHHGS